MLHGEDSDRQTSDGRTDRRTDGHTGVQLHMHSTGTAARGSMPGSSARGLLTRGRACEAAGLEPAASAVEGRHVECDADEDGADERGAGENGAGERDADERGADERGAGERDDDERDGLRGSLPCHTSTAMSVKPCAGGKLYSRRASGRVVRNG